MLEIKAIKSEYGFASDIGLLVLDRETRQALDSVQMVTVPIGARIPQTPLTLSPTQAQILMDSLWDCGLRPSEGSGSAGALKAVQNHLEDMRTLVFKAHAIQRPE